MFNNCPLFMDKINSLDLEWHPSVSRVGHQICNVHAQCMRMNDLSLVTIWSIYVTWSPFCHQLGCRLSRVSSIYLRGTFDLPLHEDRYLFRLTFTWPWLVLSQVCPNTIVWPWPSTDLHPITSTRAKTSTHLLMWYICTVYVLLWNYTSQ